MTHKSTWKARERQVARYLGTRRTPLSGGGSGHTRSDTLHERLFVEVKLRARFPLLEYWDKARAEAGRSEVPLVRIVQKGTPEYWLLWHHKDTERLAADVGGYSTVGRTVIETASRAVFAIASLWKATTILAEAEKKVPVLALIQKHRHGFWFVSYLPYWYATLLEIARTRRNLLADQAET